jgi:hypothetical protein
MASTVLGCFTLAPGIDEALQRKAVQLTMVAAALSLVIALMTLIGGILRDGFSVMALINPVLVVLICVVGVPTCLQQSLVKQNSGFMLSAVVGHFTNSVCSVLGIAGLWWAASTQLGYCEDPEYNCPDQLVNGTECVINVPGWGGRTMEQKISKSTCENGFGAAPIVFSLVILVVVAVSFYAGVVLCKVKPMLQLHHVAPGAQVVGTTAQVQIVQPTVQIVQPTIVTATVVKSQA